MGEEVKLIGAKGSPFTHRVELALNLKGINYEFLEEDPTNKSPLLLKYNPIHKKIPVLVHNLKPIAESALIIEYIDQTWPHPPSILPQLPYNRAISRFWAKFIDDKCVISLFNACWIRGEEQGKAIEEASELLMFLEDELEDEKFFGGDSVGFLDIMANFIAYWFRLIQEVSRTEVLTNQKFPKLYKWADEFVNCKAVQETLPPRDFLIGVFRTRFEASQTLKDNPQISK